MAGDTDEVEWLDGEQPAQPFRRNLPRGVWYVLLGALVLVVVLTLVLTSRHARRAASPARSNSISSTAVPIGVPTGNVLPPPSVINLGQPLLRKVPGTWELVARGDDAVYQIQLSTGRIARAGAPISAGEAVSFLVGPDDVLVRPWDCVNGVDGYLIRDGPAASALPGMLANCGVALPGPRPGQVWVPSDDQTDPRLLLVDLHGRPTGAWIPGQPYGEVPDGAGYALVSLVGGVYDARPDGLHRITTGRVLATGPTGYLTEECDNRHTCTTDLIERHGDSHRVPGPPPDQFSSGVLSPDGTRAALVTQAPTDTDTVAVHLIDLGSGTDHTTPVTLSARQQPAGAMAWSPDSRWLFVADATGHILTLDRSGHPHPLDTQLPAIDQLAIR
jgi:hypothetical protein